MSTFAGRDTRRVGDDLYTLYLAGLAWLLLPMYASVLARVLPSEIGSVDRITDVAAAGALVAPLWIGYRGGPLLLNRAVILHELGAPPGRRSILTARVARQGVAWAVLAALAVDGLAAMSGAEAFGYGAAARHSAVAAVAGFAAVVHAVGWLVLAKAAPSDPESPGRSVRWAVAAANGVAAAVVVAAVAAGVPLGSGPGLLLLVGALVVGLVGGRVAIGGVPLSHLWRRATALEGLRSAALSFDFQRVVVSLRRAADQTEARRARVALARRWMPLGPWRYLCGLQQGWNTRFVQVATATVAAGAVAAAGPANGVVALAVSAAGLVVGLELASPIASTAGQSTFAVHYPRGSVVVFVGQLATALAVATALAAAAFGWLAWSNGPVVAAATGGLFVFGTMAAAVQGRLGSPDLAWLSERLGTFLPQALWIRSLLGPLLSLALTVVVFHNWLRPDGFAIGPFPVVVLVLIGLTVACYPLERQLP